MKVEYLDKLFFDKNVTCDEEFDKKYSLVHGHVKFLGDYLKTVYGENYTCLYIGDTILSDCMLSFDEH